MSERRRVRVVDQGAKAQPVDAPVAIPEFDTANASPVTATDGAACGCPHLDRDDWHEVESDWSDITFVSTSTNAVMGVPVAFGSVRGKLRQKAEKAGATIPDDAMFLIGGGRFRRPVMLEVDDAAPDAKGVERPGGVAYSELLPAPWGKMQSVVDGVEANAKARYGRDPDDVWVWYVTCRVCSAERDFETLIIAHYREAV